MVLYVLIGTLAAVGLMSVLWVCFGWLLPGAKGCAFVCVGWPEEGLQSRYRWLRDLGILHCPMLIVTENQTDKTEVFFGSGMEICSWDALWQRLERERTNRDGTGNGNPPGRNQCRGISEL